RRQTPTEFATGTAGTALAFRAEELPRRARAARNHPGSGAADLVPGPGLEPGYSAPKADVLPIRRSRNRSWNCSREKRAHPGRALRQLAKFMEIGRSAGVPVAVLGRVTNAMLWM